MLVQVRLFAMLRERAGRDRVAIELDDGATVRDALEVVGGAHGLDDLIERMPVAAAVNREYVQPDSALHEGDELALIPPVSGGDDGAAAEATDFRSGEGYGSFMELVGNHVPRRPGYSKFLGTRPLHAEPGHVRLEFTASEEMLNPAGVVQGGFITAMLDEAMGPAALAGLGPGHTVPTLELKVSFIRPLRPGIVVADARVVHQGRSVVFMESSLFDADEQLIATATATARVIKLDPS